jgi:GH25 family lysozyme M1 (1,4-beta-N-acetylmuramidase)
MILGVDLSSNNAVFSFPQAQSQGCRTAYVKLGGDNIPTYLSSSYAPRVDAAHAVGWPVGSYWITGGHNPDAAAAFFTAHLEAFGAPDYVVLDNESLDSGNVYNDAEAAEWVRQVHAHVGGNPARILHYGSKSFMESHAWPQLLATGCSFLIADYNGTPLQNHVPSTIPASRVVGHQYADNGNIGGGGPVDLNAFVDSFLSTISTASTTATPITLETLMALKDSIQFFTNPKRGVFLAGPAAWLPIDNRDGVNGQHKIDLLNKYVGAIPVTEVSDVADWDALNQTFKDWALASASGK